LAAFADAAAPSDPSGIVTTNSIRNDIATSWRRRRARADLRPAPPVERRKRGTRGRLIGGLEPPRSRRCGGSTPTRRTRRARRTCAVPCTGDRRTPS
jgi:hypothetical protein